MSPDPEKKVQSQSESSTVQLERFNFSRVIFELLQKQRPSEGETRPANVPLSISVTASIESNAELMSAVVTLDTTITADQKWQPYRIEVTVSGGFHGANVTPEQFDQFCRMGAPPILFPYVREMIHRITMDAPYGVILLQPINIAALLNANPWISPDQTTTTTEVSTEP